MSEEHSTLKESFNLYIEKINKTIDMTNYAMYKQNSNPEAIYKLENSISSKSILYLFTLIYLYRKGKEFKVFKD